MNISMGDHPGAMYQQAEQKALGYYTALCRQVMDRSYVSALTGDFHKWKKKHLRRFADLSFLTQRTKRPEPRDYYRYIQWLRYTGRLEDYLDRSVSYIYLRDLGRALDSPDTERRIRRTIEDLDKYLMKSVSPGKGGEPDFMNPAGVYRWAQKEGIEPAVIWLFAKLRAVAAHIPEGMNAEHAQRKLIKIIVGVVLHVTEEMDEGITAAERSRRLDQALRLGYSYGLTYPFVDDLLDSQILTAVEKTQYSELIRTALLTGNVPQLGGWQGGNMRLIQYIHTELSEAFEYIKAAQNPEAQSSFFGQSYVFFQAQDTDRVKRLDKADYTNEELYIPVILKSSSSRLVARSVLGAPEDEGFADRTFFFGIYNQLADDFADMDQDMKDGAVTPYTYYLQYHRERPELINPFELYWAVIANLIHGVYNSSSKVREVMLDRAINGLKRFKERAGADKYNETMRIFTAGIPELNRLVQTLVRKADEVDFFDKLLRDRMVEHLRRDAQQQEEFSATFQHARSLINNELLFTRRQGQPAKVGQLTDTANYSLEGDAKRMRPILAWVMGVKVYNLESAALLPLLRSLEYMHTASLIFDDLPSQDNAATRRGRMTLHEAQSSAVAELTGLYLIQKAIGEQASLHRFLPETVLALIRYSALKAEEMCTGQVMDLDAVGKELSLEQLNQICFFKTGVAFEACLVMPAMLAGAGETELSALKTFAYHMGIAFQIKDDLLDVEGDMQLLGKPVGNDAANNKSNFASVLGTDGASRAMWEHYCQATDALSGIPSTVPFLKHLMNYVVNRER
ncbi:polyprenyl synthetase family protein [Paenibacillus sp. MMS20-IR301]|uniref:polyprenyl synthetase family protein n=1 Tax=Paenibacillus sp. MMS20-IR301 TaxID=2895946 RepID=UPI0028EECE7B|nr:polyprenyl synthetase family protein [Paenibacillus sp. MMS20-IR301]WNS45591.1 polyprenyl synthetase family protein [Paenibacillus sp. MMS20-IR301]